MAVWLLIPTAMAAECADPAAQADRARDAVLTADLDTAAEAVAAAESAFACSGTAQPEVLAKLWLAESLLWTYEGDPAAAQDALAAAAWVAPGVWDSGYGEPTRDRHLALAGQEPAADASIAVQPPTTSWLTAVDGQAVSAPAAVRPGLHLVQVGPTSSEMRFAKFVYVSPGQNLVVETGLTEVVPTATVLPGDGPEPVPQRSLPPLLIAAGSAAAVSVLTGAAALGQDRAMRNAADQGSVQGVDRAFARQKALGATSYLTAATAGALVGVHLVW